MKNVKILVAGGDSTTAELFAIPLKVRGFNVSMAEGGLGDIIKKVADEKPEILVLDADVSGGEEEVRRIREMFPGMEILAALTTGDEEATRNLFVAGAAGLLRKPLDMENLLLEIGRAAGRRESGADNGNRRPATESAKKGFLGTARVLANLVETFDPSLAGHSKRVSFFCRAIGVRMGLDAAQLLEVEIAGLLHDIGKLALPEKLLNARLEDLKAHEVELIRKHPIFAETMLGTSEEFKGLSDLIRHHLERMDGTGFPDKLARDGITPGARVLGVANAYDELKQRRLFTLEAFSSEKAKEEFALGHLNRYAGSHFDPAVIDALEKVVFTFIHKIRGETTTVERLTPGMMVSSDIVTKDGRLLVARGLMLNPLQIMRIRAYYEMGLVPRETVVERPVKVY